MSARTWLRWDLVDCNSDPVPASSWDVKVVADEMQSRADDAQDMHDKLRALADLDGWRGEAAEEFADKADDVLGDLEKVEDRYSKVAKALSTWKGEVDKARTATQDAVTKAETADEVMRNNAAYTGVGPPTPEQKSADDKHDDAARDLRQAKKDLQDALDDLDSAAGRAEDAIDEAADVWDDGWWGNFKGWVRRHAEVISIVCKVLEVVAAIAAVVILVCALVASAPFALLVGAAIVGGLLLLGHTALVVSDTGKASWVDVGFDILNLATLGLGGGLASMASKGLGRLVATVAPRVGSATRLAALERLAGGSMTQLSNALKIRNPANNLARWANGIVRTATSEGDDAAAAIRNLTNITPSRLSTLLHQDRELASMMTAVSRLRGVVTTGDEAAALARIRNLGLGSLGAGTVGNIVALGKDVPGAIGHIADLVGSGD